MAPWAPWCSGARLTEADFRGRAFPRPPARPASGDNDVLVLTRPDVIRAIHEEYLAAGADIIETCTFTSTAVAQADYGLEPFVHEMNVAAARLARQAADDWTARTPGRPRLVAGSIGPTNRTLSLSPDVNDPSFRVVTFDQLRDAYAEQVRGLVDGGCDVAAHRDDLRHAQRQGGDRRRRRRLRGAGRDLPLMVSVTITDRSGRTLSGQTVDAFWMSVAHARPLTRRDQLRARRPRDAALRRGAVARRRHPRQLLPQRRPAERVRRLRRDARADGRGSSASSPTRASSTSSAAAAARRPEHIARDRRRRRGRAAPPGSRPADRFTRYAGLETLTIRPDSNFQMIGERTNVTGSARFRRLDHVRRLRRRRPMSPSNRCAAGRTSSTSTWTRRCSTPSRR